MAKRKNVAELLIDFSAGNQLRKSKYESACAKSRELAAVRDDIKKLALKAMERALFGGEGGEAAIDSLMQKEAAILSSVGEAEFNCKKCGDTGEHNGKNCSCLLNRIYTECYGAVDISGSGISFSAFDLDVFDGGEPLAGKLTQRDIMARYRDVAMGYIRDFPHNPVKNMLMTGKTGLGKSFLMYCMAVEAVKNGIGCMLIRANDLYGVFFAHRMGEEVDLSYLERVELLMIDDLGTEPVTQNVSSEYLYDLLSRRIENGMHTVIATNADDLHKRYNDRIASRLYSKEDFISLYFDGRDIRP